MTDDVPPPAAPDDARDEFRRADVIFDAALDLEPYERATYVERACEGDPPLRDAVLRLLRAHERSTDFLTQRLADPSRLLTSAPQGSDDDDDDDVQLRARIQRLLGDAYVLESRVARGGMAIVYRARDVRHDRTVAVKVLDPALGAAIDPDAGAKRFLAEIRTAARLNHPNLLPLFDSGAGDGLLFYVMPFIAGETLRQRMQRESPLPVDEAVRTALGVASALEYAHTQGVVHRDLKPENILLHAGQPLVADFGIAFAASNAGGARATRAGFHLGTPQYMAPEQVSGSGAVDASADVYALGAVTYEMLTGEPPHSASNAQAVLAKRVSERPTPVRVLRASVPPHVALAVERALERLPVDRFSSAEEFAVALARPVDAGDRAVPRRAGVVLGVLAVGVAAVALWPRARDVVEPPPPASFFVVAPISDAGIGRSPALTPDGERLVYPGSAETQRRVFVRRINELNARPIPHTEGALSAFVSPDGRSVAFLTNDDRLKTVPIEGGPVTDLGGVFRYMDAHWGAGDRIVLSSLRHRGLAWIPAGGGAERQLTRRDATMIETRHTAPLLHRDGATVLFTAERGRDGPIAAEGELAVVLLDPSAEEPVRHSLLGVRARRAVGIVDGWLLYVSPDGSGLMAIRFDVASRRVSGEPVVVLDHQHGGIDEASLADNGTLLYTRRRSVNAPVLVDSTGAVRPLLSGLSGDFMNPRVSPDGRRLVVQAASARGTDVLIFDLAAPSPMRLTTSGQAIGPTWMADNERVVFLSGAGGATAFWMQPADGGAPAQSIAEGEGIFAVDVGGDGSILLFQRQVRGVWEIWSARTGVQNVLQPVVAERFDAYMPALSPDGRWLAYTSNATSRNEVFVRPFPGPGVPVQISDEGGTEPVWSRDGRRLHYRGDRRMLAATIVTEPSLAVSDRKTLFTDAFDSDMPMPHRNYDVSPDGQFVMIAAAGGHGVETVVGVGWLSELRARLSHVR